MAAAVASEMSSYDLPISVSGRFSPPAAEKRRTAYLPESFLVRNVLWFCRLRWIVVGALVAFGTLGLFPNLLPRIGLCAHRHWPFIAGTILALANLGFVAHARRLKQSGAAHGANANLWAQIIGDLLLLTVIVHYLGSLETYVAFAYLFHIVFACIFFPRSWSLAVTAIACGLYVTCVALEEADVLPLACIYVSTVLREHMQRLPGVIPLNVAWAVLTWTTVWYLASRLSGMVTERDSELAESNRLLVEAQKERTRHMLRTTHELKAPFSAIHANVQFLSEGYCGELPAAATEVLDRIARRSRRLAGEIQEMLQLANLTSVREDALPWVELDLDETLNGCITQVQPLAEEHGVIIEQDVRPVRAVAVEDHMRMLFGNLLTNAVIYSHQGGRVRVRCTSMPGGRPVVAIEDHGIGVPREKLPHIFDEYYHTEEATQHNKESTGLGLAIVRQVATAHGIHVRVESEPGVGSTFTLTFPAPGRSLDTERHAKEIDHGLSDDRG